MDAIKEMLARITELSGDELTQLLSLISDAFAEVDEMSKTDPAGVIAQMGELVEAKEAAKGEQTRRSQLEAAATAQAEELRQRMAATDADPEEGSNEAPTAGVDDDEKQKVAKAEGDGSSTEGGSAPEGAPSPLPLAASAATGNRVARMAAAGAKPSRSPESPGSSGRAALVAAAGARGPVAAGQPLDRDSLAETLGETLMRNPKPSSGRSHDIIVASARWNYPEERQLGSDAALNTKRMDAVVGRNPEALVASGGICAPVNVDYSVPTWSSADRPLRDGLPVFQADRGGVTFLTPPVLSDLIDATGVWTEATDASPGSATKPVLAVACGNSQTALVDAVPTRLQFGNMQSRFAPEQIAANTDLALAQAARIAELNLLAKIDAASTLVTTTQLIGASRDFLATLDIAASAYRYRYRVARSQRLTCILPDWAHDVFRADIVRELAHDTSGLDPRAVTDAQINAWIAARGVDVIWTLDGRATDALGGSTNPFQGFDTQSAGAINPWPNDGTDVELDWNLFVQGAMQFLDGGRLDLGVVRDATLDGTNDYETFVEVFEGVAFRGNEALTIRSVLLPNGASVGSVAASTYTVLA